MHWQDVSPGEQGCSGRLKATLHEGRLSSGFAAPGCERLYAAAAIYPFKESREGSHRRGALAGAQGREGASGDQEFVEAERRAVRGKPSQPANHRALVASWILVEQDEAEG